MEENIEIINPYGFIYITTNLINGKKYIGQKLFIKYWQNYLGSGIQLINAIKKYGKEYFSREIIAIAYSEDELNKLEKESIKIHNAVKSNDYYNITHGGDGGWIGLKHSEESKIKMSQSRTGLHPSKETIEKLKQRTGENNPHYGKHHTEETKRKISEKKKGKVYTEERKLKMNFTWLKGKNNPRYGIKTSEETKFKQSEAKRKFDNENVNEIRNKYATGKYTITSLAQEYKVAISLISNVINHKRAYKYI